MGSYIKSDRAEPFGRPCEYTEELGDLICQKVSTHPWGIDRIIKKYPDLPCRVTINKWRHWFPEFATKYAQAKILQAELLAEDILDISDDDSQDKRVDENGNTVCNTEFIARSRLRVDTRKWLAAKLIPKIYGPHSQPQHVVVSSHEDALKELE